jgi:hypothetical protein
MRPGNSSEKIRFTAMDNKPWRLPAGNISIP